MTAVARTMMPDRGGDDLPIATMTPRSSIHDDRELSSAIPETPWRAPLFYLAAVAAIALMIAVGVVLLWRVATRSKSA